MAEEAKKLQALAKAGMEKYERVSVLTDRLKQKGVPFARAGEYLKAIRAIKKDKDYLKNKDDLKELNEQLKTWQRKAVEMGQ